jgi:hypothetical protein
MTFAETTTIFVPPSMIYICKKTISFLKQVNHFNACPNEKAEEKEELETEKENAPLHNKLFDLLKTESQVNINKETKEATFNIKSKDTPTKVKAKTPKCSRVPRMPASVSRPASSIPRESIDYADDAQ